MKQSRFSRYPLLSLNRGTRAAGSARELRALLRPLRDSLTFGNNSDLLTCRGDSPLTDLRGILKSGKAATTPRCCKRVPSTLALHLYSGARHAGASLRGCITRRHNAEAERTRPASVASGAKILLKPIVRRTRKMIAPERWYRTHAGASALIALARAE